MAKSPLDELFDGENKQSVALTVKCSAEERTEVTLFCKNRQIDRHLFIMASIKEGYMRYAERLARQADPEGGE